MSVLVLGSDLFFASRIAEVARSLGVAATRAAGADAAVARAAGARLVFVDLLARDLDAPGAIRRLVAAAPEARVIAFFPHVEAELGDAARAAGAHAVLTRGQLTKQLPQLVGELVSPG